MSSTSGLRSKRRAVRIRRSSKVSSGAASPALASARSSAIDELLQVDAIKLAERFPPDRFALFPMLRERLDVLRQKAAEVREQLREVAARVEVVDRLHEVVADERGLFEVALLD